MPWKIYRIRDCKDGPPDRARYPRKAASVDKLPMQGICKFRKDRFAHFLFFTAFCIAKQQRKTTIIPKIVRFLT